MITIKKMLLGAAMIAPAALATAAVAQVNGIAVADPQNAVLTSQAFATARTQIETTYKTQIDQAEARGKAIDAELQPLVAQFQAAQRAPNANQAALQTQLQTIQSRQTAGREEIARIVQPAQRAQAYAAEQVQARLGEAVQNVMKARNVSLLVSPQSVLVAQPTADLTSAIAAELNRLVPTVSTAVPANWQPGQAQAQGAAPAAAAPTTGGNRRNGGR